MSLQSENLSMIGLGVRGNVPADAYQPVLPDGIHLRWAFDRDLGFPWHGFHLFRRPARAGTPLCLSSVSGGLKKGGARGRSYYTALGSLSSDADLVLSDEFVPDGQPEYALDGRAHLRFDLPEGEPARRVDLRIGFRAACLDARALLLAPAAEPAGQPAGPTAERSVFRPNPLAVQETTFTVKGANGKPDTRTQFDLVATPSGPLVGLACGYGLSVRLPTASTTVELLVTHTLASATIDAYDPGSHKVASATTQAAPGEPETIRLTGGRIVRIEIRTLRNTAHLHRICFTRAAGEEKGSVKVIAFSGSKAVRTVLVTGQAGQVAAASVGGDAITAVEIGPGPAALVDLCVVPVAQDAAKGWETLRGFPYPMGLPVTQPAYPCSVPNPASLLAQRVVHPLPPEWTSTSFADLEGQLAPLVAGGPAGPPMAERILTAPAAPSAPQSAGAPDLGSFYTLDLLDLASVHPALAQLLGLYWVDRTAARTSAYDYLVVADHTGAGQHSAAGVLAAIQATGFAQLDGYILFDRAGAADAPLAAPTGLVAQELTGGSFPDAQGQLAAAFNNAGLRWDLAWDDEGELLPESPVTYLLWRAFLGNGAASAAAGPHALVTKVPPDRPRPVMVTEARLPEGSVPDRPPDWPAAPAYYTDRNLPDGWYSFRASGIDLFGRHSAAGAPAVVLLRDHLAPPCPTGVEAYALDPADPYLQRDTAYQSWYAGVDPALVGLRVRWTWTHAHQRQAPDTAEFRIYLHPGADLPPDREQPASWLHRWFVVGYASNVQVDPQSGDRVYEVFMPPPAAASPPTLPLLPTLAQPVAYAQVGVSAADGAVHGIDPRPAGTWGGRPGNEGSVGPPATIYRVLRDLPPSPEPVQAGERCWASPADYRGRSFFTYRWLPQPHLKLHLYRALDDALFRADWAARPVPQLLDASQAGVFPTGWNPATRQQVADELNALNAFAALPGGAAQASGYYRQLSDGALRVLASLPGSESAFAQITLEPLDPGLAANANRLGPDDADGTPIDPTLRAYLDELDGRAPGNRYLYRAALADEAHNLGPMGPAGPPVYLPRVVPPPPPVLTRAVGGERSIRLRWAQNGAAGVSAYRVYRTGVAADARDVRLMEPVGEVAVGDVVLEGGEVAWTDQGVPAGRDLHYRVTALDSESARNESAPSKVAVGRAVDTALPTTPQWLGAEWVVYDPGPGIAQPWDGQQAILPPGVPAVRLALTVGTGVCTVLRRLTGEAEWKPVVPPPGYVDGPWNGFDLQAPAGAAVSYRAQAGNALGVRSTYTPVVVVEPA